MILNEMEAPQHNFSIPVSIVPVSQQLAQQDKQHQQQSVIQSSQGQQSSSQFQQQLQSMHDGDLNDDENRKRRDILTRRPSYRKILNDLSSDSPVKMENYDENGGGSSRASSPDDDDEASINLHQGQPDQAPYNTSLHINGSAPQGSPAAVVQLAQGGPAPDGTQYILTTQGPGNKIQTYTIKGQLPSVISSPATSSPQMLAEEATRKREIRLYKNREAARECRRKKKEYVKCLENRVAVLENQNKALIEELKSLKDLYCSKGD